MMTVDKTPETENSLDALRARIDALDAVLLQTLSDRAQCVDAIGRYKKARDLPPLDAARWEQVLQGRMAQAQALGLCPDFIEQLYHLIHAYSLHLESNSEHLP